MQEPKWLLFYSHLDPVWLLYMVGTGSVFCYYFVNNVNIVNVEYFHIWSLYIICNPLL